MNEKMIEEREERKDEGRGEKQTDYRVMGGQCLRQPLQYQLMPRQSIDLTSQKDNSLRAERKAGETKGVQK